MEKRRGSKLTHRQAEAIRLLVKAGRLTRKQIASRFGVTLATISHVVNRVTWR